MAIQKQISTAQDQEEEELVPVRWLTEEEAFAVLDMQARKRLNMSGEEFLKKWRADAFSEQFKDEHHSAYAVLSLMATPFGR